MTSETRAELVAESARRRDPSWDFGGEPTKSHTHGLHTYPAMMIPQVAARLIGQLTKKGETVLDPFCGSGSVLLEAVLAGRQAVGVDLNPLALLIARAKTTPLTGPALESALEAIESLLPDLLADPPKPPAVPGLDFWFKPEVIRDLAALRAAVLHLPQTAIREFFLVTLSEVVRLASNSRSSEFKLYRYPPDRLATHQPDAVAIFRDRARRNITAMVEDCAACLPTRAAKVLLADSRNLAGLVADGSVDAIITSPPYGDSGTTVAYGQFSRLSAEWLGLEGARRLDRDLLGGSRRIGPRCDHGSKLLDKTLVRIAETSPARSAAVARFYVDLLSCLRNMARVLRAGGRAGIVVGNRRVAGGQIPTDLILAEQAAAVGLCLEEVVIRAIPTKRLPLRNSPSNIAGATGETMRHEYIVLLRKP